MQAHSPSHGARLCCNLRRDVGKRHEKMPVILLLSPLHKNKTSLACRRDDCFCVFWSLRTPQRQRGNYWPAASDSISRLRCFPDKSGPPPKSEILSLAYTFEGWLIFEEINGCLDSCLPCSKLFRILRIYGSRCALESYVWLTAFQSKIEYLIWHLNGTVNRLFSGCLRQLREIVKWFVCQMG